MYLRAAHAELDIPSLRRFIRANPLGVLITAFDCPGVPTIQCTHLPWVLDDPSGENPSGEEGSGGEGSENPPTPILGRLRGHMARANPHAKSLSSVVSGGSGSGGSGNGLLLQSPESPSPREVSILFTSATHNYVTPKFYTETKPDTGKVVPTWDYAAVQAYGTLRVYSDARDPDTGSYLQRQVEDLTDLNEEEGGKAGGEEGEGGKWKVSDAPASYVELLKKSIIGVEVEITRLEGKYKMSQEMGRGDRDGVVRGFETMGTEHGSEMARLVAERGRLRDEQVERQKAQKVKAAQGLV